MILVLGPLDANRPVETHFQAFCLLTECAMSVGQSIDCSQLRAVAPKVVQVVLSSVDSQLQSTAWLGLARSKQVKSTGPSGEAQMAAEALNLLSERLVPALDNLFSSGTLRDSLVPLLTTLWTNIYPFLKQRSASNAKNFKACSRLCEQLTGTWLL